MKNIAVALDLSNSSNVLIKQAKVLARANDAKIWLIHIAAPDPDFIGYDVGPNYIREDRAEVLKEEHKTLGDLKNSLTDVGVEAEALLIQGPIVQTLLEELDKLNIDLLVIGKKGHGLLHRAILGSAFDAIVKKVHIPMLAVPYLED
jgi:nucleotide-binding universal stress UspA family protein